MVYGHKGKQKYPKSPTNDRNNLKITLDEKKRKQEEKKRKKRHICENGISSRRCRSF